MKKKIIRLHHTDSTNTYLSRYAGDSDDDLVVGTADYQSKGRGQGTNTWESEDGKNLLFSMLVKPTGVEAENQFVLSMAEALALKEAIDSMIRQSCGGEDVRLKWPNDIYWRDYKISGTLIETALSGKSVRQCIFGTGINVNQETFISSAPNPVSLCHILGREVSVDQLLDKVLEAFRRYYQLVLDGSYAAIRHSYIEALYRREGVHRYRDAQGLFEAEFADVTDEGRLVLRAVGGGLREYGFKEVAFVND